MRTPLRNAKAGDSSRAARDSARVREQKKHPTSLDREERHLGAREDQMSVTMPPKGDDDEPKQG